MTDFHQGVYVPIHPIKRPQLLQDRVRRLDIKDIIALQASIHHVLTHKCLSRLVRARVRPVIGIRGHPETLQITSVIRRHPINLGTHHGRQEVLRISQFLNRSGPLSRLQPLRILRIRRRQFRKGSNEDLKRFNLIC